MVGTGARTSAVGRALRHGRAHAGATGRSSSSWHLQSKPYVRCRHSFSRRPGVRPARRSVHRAAAQTPPSRLHSPRARLHAGLKRIDSARPQARSLFSQRSTRACCSPAPRACQFKVAACKVLLSAPEPPNRSGACRRRRRRRPPVERGPPATRPALQRTIQPRAHQAAFISALPGPLAALPLQLCSTAGAQQAPLTPLPHLQASAHGGGLWVVARRDAGADAAPGNRGGARPRVGWRHHRGEFRRRPQRRRRTLRCRALPSSTLPAVSPRLLPLRTTPAAGQRQRAGALLWRRRPRVRSEDPVQRPGAALRCARRAAPRERAAAPPPPALAGPGLRAASQVPCVPPAASLPPSPPARTRQARLPSRR